MSELVYIGIINHTHDWSEELTFEDLLAEGDYAIKACDRRYNVGFRHYNYCPHTGNKIDWKELKNKAKSYFDELTKGE